MMTALVNHYEAGASEMSASPPSARGEGHLSVAPARSGTSVPLMNGAPSNGCESLGSSLHEGD